MIKVNKNEAEMIGAPLELVVEIGIAVRTLVRGLEKADIPVEPLKKTLITAVEAAFECEFEADKAENDVREEKTDTLDKAADLLAELMRKLDERRGDTKNG